MYECAVVNSCVFITHSFISICWNLHQPKWIKALLIKAYLFIIPCVLKVKVTWHTAKYGDPYSEFVLCIYPSKCTHTMNTHPEQWAAIYAAASGEQLGSLPCSRAPRRGIDGGESTVHSLPPPTIPAGLRLEFATFRLQVWLSTIRSQLPCVLYNY